MIPPLSTNSSVTSPEYVAPSPVYATKVDDPGDWSLVDQYVKRKAAMSKIGDQAAEQCETSNPEKTKPEQKPEQKLEQKLEQSGKTKPDSGKRKSRMVVNLSKEHIVQKTIEQSHSVLDACTQ